MAANYELDLAMRNRNFELPRQLRRKLFALRILNRCFYHRKFTTTSQIPVRIINRHFPRRDAKNIVRVTRNLITINSLPAAFTLDRQFAFFDEQNRRSYFENQAFESGHSRVLGNLAG